MKLYEITERYNNILSLIDDENVSDDLIQNALEEVKEDFKEKALNLSKLIKNIESDICALDREEKRLYALKKAYKTKMESIKNYLFINMQTNNFKKLDLDIFKLTIAKNPPSLVVLPNSSIPQNYLIMQEPKIDTKKLKEDIKNGLVIKGVSLEQKESLRIR